MSSDWCTIESDPGVFTELIEKFGVEDVEVQELWGLEEELFKKLSPMYGLIFLFKWDKDIESNISSNVLDEIPDGVFFAKQVINNACGTQAIISILLNCKDKIKIGKTLTNFDNFTKSLDPESIGIALQGSDDIKKAHNSFAKPEPIQVDKDAYDDDEGEAFHFISYVPINGILYEIDGLQKGPRLLDGCDDSDWFLKAKKAIQERMQSYKGHELRFTLLGLCQNQLNKYKIMLSNENDANKKNELNELIKQEELKRLKWKNENIRRRHNYFPFIFNLLKNMAIKNKLNEPLNKAKKIKETKLKNREIERKKKDDALKKKNDTTKTSDNDVTMKDKTQTQN